MRIEKLIVAVALFSLFMISGIYIWGDVITNYNVITNTSNDFGSVYDKINETFNVTESAKEDALNTKLDGADTVWESMTGGGYTGVRDTTLSSFGIISAVFTSIAKTLGVEPYILRFALVILTIIVVFSVIYLIFRHTPPE